MRKEVIRRCIVTGESHPKKALIRVVRTPEGNVIIDQSGKSNGRGAYIVARKDAVVLARKKNAFNRALEIEVPSSLYDELMELIRE